MSKILYGNFEFEHEIESTAYRPPARVLQMSAQLTPHLIALAENGDSLWSPLGIPDSFLKAIGDAGLAKVHCVGPADARGAVASQDPVDLLSLTPWGFSEDSVQFAKQRNWVSDGAPRDSVRRVNDREFGFELEREFVCGLPGLARVSSHAELLVAIRLAAEALRTPEGKIRWVVKSRFGMASRSRILGTGIQLDDPSAGWLWKQLQKNGHVYFEPWIECDDEFTVREFSTQWMISQNDEPPVLRGWTETRTEQTGTPYAWFCKAGVPFSESEFRLALPVLKAAVERVAAAGYFGPVGIDSMQFPFSGGGSTGDGGTGECSMPAARIEAAVGETAIGETAKVVRPLQDINARLTMGRVALELAERLAPDRDAVWLQLPAKWLCRLLDVNSAEDACQWYLDRGVEISSAIQEAAREADIELPVETQAWLTSPLWLGDVLVRRCGVLVASRDRTLLTEVFRRFELLPGGNISPQASRRT